MFHILQSIRIDFGNVKAAWLCLLCASSLTLAAFERFPADPVSAGMGGAGMALARSGALAQNPALSTEGSIGLRWEQPYGLPEFGNRGVLIARQFNELGYAGSFDQYGDDDYREQRASLSGGYSVRPDVRLGMTMAWYSLEITGLPTGNAAHFTVGANGQVRPDLSVGLVWRNFSRSGLTNYVDRLPESVAAGVAFDADERTTFVLDIEQQPDWPLGVRGGLQSRVLKPLTIRAGALFDPAEYTAGFTLKHRSLHFHYALAWHQDLGATHALGLDFAWP